MFRPTAHYIVLSNFLLMCHILTLSWKTEQHVILGPRSVRVSLLFLFFTFSSMFGVSHLVSDKTKKNNNGEIDVIEWNDGNNTRCYNESCCCCCCQTYCSVCFEYLCVVLIITVSAVCNMIGYDLFNDVIRYCLWCRCVVRTRDGYGMRW